MQTHTLSNWLKLLVQGPILLRQSARSKKTYYKVALGGAGAIVIVLALNDLSRDRRKSNVLNYQDRS